MEVEDSTYLKSANLIQSNCQYLTLVRSLVAKRAQSQRDSLKTLEAYMENYKPQVKIKLNYQNYLQMIVELAYFLFTCCNFGKAPAIQMEDIRVEENYIKSNQKRFSIVIFYQIKETTPEQMEGVVFFDGVMEHIKTHLEKYFEQQANGQLSSAQAEFEAIAQLYWKQYEEIKNRDFYNDKQNYVFKALEQTNIFYQYSMLYRIKNCSILELIRSDPAKMKELKNMKLKDENLLTQYSQQKKKFKEPEALRQKERQIDANLLNFFKSINPSYFTEESLTKNDKDQSHRVHFRFAFKQQPKRPFEEFLSLLDQKESQTMAQQTKVGDLKRPLAQMQFFVDYSSQKNSICVRLLMPNLAVNVETSDFLMFQSNVLTYEAVNVSIELSQKSEPPAKSESVPPAKSGSAAPPPPKIVSFKGTSSFNVKQPVLQKILLLMDITMIACRVYEPELNPQKYSHEHGKDISQRMITISKKVSHYTKLFMRCAKKVYNQ